MRGAEYRDLPEIHASSGQGRRSQAVRDRGQSAVRQLIERRTGVQLSLSAISLHLAAWGFTAKKPIRRATERDEAAIRTWIEHDYPATVERAKKEKAEIHWADETGISNQANYGRSLRAARRDIGDPKADGAVHAVDDLQPDQPGQAAVHGV